LSNYFNMATGPVPAGSPAACPRQDDFRSEALEAKP
jgi:hypothetical protein